MMNSKWAVSVLIASVVLNLLLIGYLLGQRSAPGMFGDPSRVFPRWIHALPAERQAQLRPVLKEHLRGMRTTVPTMRRHHRAVREAIATEPFDPGLLHSALDGLLEQQQLVQNHMHDAFVVFVQELTPNERKTLLGDMRRHRSPPWRKSHMRD